MSQDVVFLRFQTQDDNNYPMYRLAVGGGRGRGVVVKKKKKKGDRFAIVVEREPNYRYFLRLLACSNSTIASITSFYCTLQ